MYIMIDFMILMSEVNLRGLTLVDCSAGKVGRRKVSDAVAENVR